MAPARRGRTSFEATATLRRAEPETLTGNDEESLCGVGEAAEDAADGPEQRAPPVRVAQQQDEARQRDGAVGQQIQERCAVAFPKLLRQVQGLSSELRLQHTHRSLSTCPPIHLRSLPWHRAGHVKHRPLS